LLIFGAPIIYYNWPPRQAVSYNLFSVCVCFATGFHGTMGGSYMVSISDRLCLGRQNYTMNLAGCQ